MVGKLMPKRVLLIRPSALGDVCRTVPVLTSLARAWPEATLGWVVQDGFEDAIRCHEDLDEVLTFPRKALAKWATRPQVLMRSLGWMRSLRKGRWDCVIDCQGLMRSALMTRATGAALRVGDRQAREGAWLAYNHRVDTTGVVHTVDRMLELLKPLQIDPVKDMQLKVPPEAESSWSSRRSELGLNGSYFVLAATTRWPSKAWPADHWVEWARSVGGMTDGGLVLLGSPTERAMVESLATRLTNEAGMTVHNLAGETSVGEMMAVIESARLTLANDTAALHMAVGLGGRCVGLFGPTDPDVVGPYGLRERVVHVSPPPGVNYRDARLGDRCMRMIPVEQVVECTRRVWDETQLDAVAQVNA